MQPDRMKILSIATLQGLADLGYPKEVRVSMNPVEAEKIIKNNTKYSKKEIPVASETKLDSRPAVIPEYIGEPVFKAAYDLDLEKLTPLVKNLGSINKKDKDLNTLLHLVAMMAFQNFDKAVEVINFLKLQGANIYLKDKDNLNPVEIAKARKERTPEYQKIVEALES